MKKYVNINHKSYIRLLSVSVEGCKVEYRFSVSRDLEPYFEDKVLWAEYPFPITEVPVGILTIPFVASVMPVAWLYGSLIFVTQLDDEFYHAVLRLREAYQNMYPSVLLGGAVYPSSISYDRIDSKNHRNGSLFSGGLDAVTTFVRHKDSIEYLIYTNGLFDSDKANRTYESETSIITDFVRAYDVTPVFVKSNFYTFIDLALLTKKNHRHFNDFWHDLYHSLAFLGFSSTVAYNFNLGKIFIGSSNTPDCWVHCASDPTTDIEFRFSGVSVVHDGFELDRQDKLRIVIEQVQKTGIPVNLHVCSFNKRNCCACEKCWRTIWGLVAECEDPRRYGFDFDDRIDRCFRKVIRESGAFLDFEFDAKIYWPAIKRRMLENYTAMTEEQKAVSDSFMAFDCQKERKRCLRRYYSHNFFSIIRRKISEFVVK